MNEAFAQKYFAGTNPIGQRLSAGLRGKPRELEIVGVARNTNNVALRMTPTATVYLAFQQFDSGFPTTSLVARVRSSAAADAASIRQMLQAKLPDTVLEVRPMSAQVASTIVQERMLATLAGGFGVLALLLACVGLYGLLAYSVTQRIKEIGIRMALGSTRQERGAGTEWSGPPGACIAVGLRAYRARSSRCSRRRAWTRSVLRHVASLRTTAAFASTRAVESPLVACAE